MSELRREPLNEPLLVFDAVPKNPTDYAPLWYHRNALGISKDVSVASSSGGDKSTSFLLWDDKPS